MNNNYKREIRRAWNIFQPKYWVYNFLGECCWGFELLLLVCFSMFWVFVTFTVVTLMGEKNYWRWWALFALGFFSFMGPRRVELVTSKPFLAGCLPVSFFRAFFVVFRLGPFTFKLRRVVTLFSQFIIFIFGVCNCILKIYFV